MAQYLAVWYKSPEGMGPKVPATFTNSLADNGMAFELVEKASLGPVKENSLGFALMEGDVVVGCVTWIGLGIKYTLREGDTVELHAVTPTEDEWMDKNCNCGHADCNLCGEFSDVGRSDAMRLVYWLAILIASILFWSSIAWVVFK